MAVQYNKLQHLLIDRKMTLRELSDAAGFSLNIPTRIRRDAYISLESVEKICNVLNCIVDDILDFIPDEPKEESK